MIEIIRKRWPTSEEEKIARDVGQQPLDKDGYTNENFKKYGTKNPWEGTERDRSKRKRYF